MLKHLQDKQRVIEDSQGSHAQSQRVKHSMVVMPADYERSLVMFKTKLFSGIKESDYPLLRPTLPTICTLAYFTCQQTLRQFAHQPFLENQALLLKQLSGNALEQLRQTIEITTDYLGNVLKEDRVNQVIELCARFPDDRTPDDHECVGLALCDTPNEKIYINLTPKILIGSDISDVVLTVIHEMSHMAAMTSDFARVETPRTETGDPVFALNHCIQLAEQAEYDPTFFAPVERRKVEDIIRLLEPVCDRQPRIPLGQYLATQNADTIALAVMGISAMAAGFGRVIDKFLPPINVDNRQNLRGEWIVLKLDREFFSSNLIKSMPEEFDTTSCRSQTPPPNPSRAIGLDSDDEKQSPPKLGATDYAKVAKLTHILAEPSIPSELGVSTPRTQQFGAKCPKQATLSQITFDGNLLLSE